MICFTKLVDDKYRQYIRYKEHTFYEIISTNIIFLGEKRVLTPVVQVINESGEIIFIPAFNVVAGKSKEDVEKLLEMFEKECSPPQ